MRVLSLIFFLLASFSVFSNENFNNPHGVFQGTELQAGTDFQNLKDLSVGDTVSSVSNSTLLLTQREFDIRARYFPIKLY